MSNLRKNLGFPDDVTLLTFDMTPFNSYGDFSDEFSEDFDIAGDRVKFSYRHIARPRERLWRKFAYPLAPNALLLWRDGRVKRAVTLTDPDIVNCDDVILGGHLFLTAEGSWQAQVLEDAGYPLMEWVDPS